MERENSDLSSTLVKKEQDLEAKAQEKEDLQSNLERTKEKLELELQRANEARHRLGQMDNQVVHINSIRVNHLKISHNYFIHLQGRFP